jgi:hypothetical protein
LISRAKAGIKIVRAEGEIGAISDARGPISSAVEKPPTSYTPELIGLLRDEYESGKTAREISKDYRLDRVAMMKHLRASGVKIRRQGLTPEQAVGAAEMYQSGLTLTAIGAWFDASQGTIGRCLRNQGIVLRPPLVRATPMV